MRTQLLSGKKLMREAIAWSTAQSRSHCARWPVSPEGHDPGGRSVAWFQRKKRWLATDCRNGRSHPKRPLLGILYNYTLVNWHRHWQIGENEFQLTIGDFQGPAGNLPQVISLRLLESQPYSWWSNEGAPKKPDLPLILWIQVSQDPGPPKGCWSDRTIPIDR